MKNVRSLTIGLAIALSFQSCGALPQMEDESSLDISQFIYKANLTDHGTEYSFLCDQQALVSSGNQTRYYRLEILARESGTYTLHYREYLAASGADQITKELDMEGTWERADHSMVFSDLGTGKAAKFQSRPSIALQISRNTKNRPISPGMPMLTRCTSATPLD